MQNRPVARAPAAFYASFLAVRASLLAALALVGVAAPTHAQFESRRIVPTISSQITWTDNVDFESSANRDSALVLELVPGVDVNYRGPRSELRGTVRAPIVVQGGGDKQGTRIYPQVSLFGRIEPVENFFFIDGNASVTQQYFSPFGARSTSLANDIDNRHTSQSYRLSPTIHGEFGPLIRYQVRDDNIWTVSNNAPRDSDVTNSYNNYFSAWVDRVATPYGWRVEYFRNKIDFRQNASELNQVVRSYGTWRPDPQVEVGLIAGYEELKLQLDRQTQDSVIYGALVRWRPTPRTVLDANWQHRVGGPSYRVVFENRTPLTVWNAEWSRSLSNYPQELLEFPTSASVPGLLDQLFLPRIPDPAERELAVARFMQEQGLPSVLSEPFTLFGNQFRIVERVRASIGLLGVRNTIFFNVYHVKTSRVTGVEAPIDLPGGEATTQRGAGATWTHRLTGVTSLVVSADVVRAESDDFADRQTDQGFLRANVTTRLTPQTSAFAGIRFQKLRSDVRPDARETAVFTGVSHTFR